MPEILRHGGRQYDWSATLIQIDGFPRRGFTSFDFGEKLDVETVYSQTQDGVPLGDTRGQYSVESFTLKMLTEYWEGFEGLKDYLSNQSPGFNGERGPFGNYGLTKFHFQLSVSDDYLPNAPSIHYDAVPCRIISAKPAGAKGAAALETELGLWCQQIKVNGMTLYAPAVGG
jgi:hypothetical protein